MSGPSLPLFSGTFAPPGNYCLLLILNERILLKPLAGEKPFALFSDYSATFQAFIFQVDKSKECRQPFWVCPT